MPKERINIPADTIINDRYRIDSIIGRGGIGTTFKALDLNTNTHVALKALEIERIENLKELELFEREIDVLKKIDNPCIPNYIKHFKTNISNHALYILVQEFVDGKNLYIHIKEGKKYREKEVLKLLKSLLTTLSYIHNLKPPIIHRDINPKNIILDKNNKLYLVDFGAVGRGRKNTLAAAKSDTFVGTLGYMPHEQLFGKLHPGLDIYSLGVTALFLLSGKEPWEFPLKDLRIDYHRAVRISVDLRYLIDKMIEPDPKKRLGSVKRVLSLLDEIQELMEEENIQAVAGTGKSPDDNYDFAEAESEWIKQAITEKKKEQKQKLKQEQKKNRELQRKKRKENKKMHRDRIKSEKFPSRIRIVQHADGSELIIKPYPFFRLLLKVHFLYSMVYFGVVVPPIMVWVGVIYFTWEFINGFGFPEYLVVFYTLSSISIDVYFVCLLIFVIITFVIRKKDHQLNIRLSRTDYCAFYCKKPKKPFYIGNKRELHLKTINDDYKLPDKKGKTNKYWGSVEIKVPDYKLPFKRTGLPQKDIELIEDFKSEHGIS